MKISQMQYILTVAETGSINKAASILGISQPNLSLSIKSLETELGFVIFERTKNGIVITEKGQELLKYANTIENAYFKIANIPKDMERAKNELYISHQNISTAFIAQLQLLKKYHSSYKIQLKEGTFSDVLYDVKTGTSKIGFITMPIALKDELVKLLQKNNLYYESLFEGKLNLLIGKQHPLAEKQTASLNDLISYPFILPAFATDDLVYSHLQSYFPLTQFKQVLYIRDYLSLFTALKEIDAISLVIETDNINENTSFIYRYIHLNNLKTLHFDKGTLPLEIGWIRQNTWKMDHFATKYINTIYEIIGKK